MKTKLAEYIEEYKNTTDEDRVSKRRIINSIVILFSEVRPSDDIPGCLKILTDVGMLPLIQQLNIRLAARYDVITQEFATDGVGETYPITTDLKPKLITSIDEPHTIFNKDEHWISQIRHAFRVVDERLLLLTDFGILSTLDMRTGVVDPVEKSGTIEKLLRDEYKRMSYNVPKR